MSDEDRDVDIESDEEELSLPSSTSANSLKHGGGHFQSQADKRAHHNALERKRRDHIKDSFSSLRDALPALQGEKASRAQILKKAAEYIQFMRRKNSAHQQDIDDLKKQNKYLEEQTFQAQKRKTFSPLSQDGSPRHVRKQIGSEENVSVRTLEKTKTTGSFAASGVLETSTQLNSKGDSISAFDGGSGSESSDTEDSKQGRRKRLKTSVLS
ncbi:protein max-like isoform X2 [Centruroides sculpturatus]|uniref:protein max-like isoform X2 n=1 Tax=Centruroides sculpturatus TaxID=218467 RepID=UPI000C6C9754|nr:protein max-like isoform X2 [Centruroides sculpturatus]